MRSATYVLLGLRYSADLVGMLARAVVSMDEPCLYPAIWRLGWELGARVEARKIIILVGERRMGPPDQHVHSALENIQELERLEELMVRLHDVTSWCELLECPVPRRRKGRQRPKK